MNHIHSWRRFKGNRFQCCGATCYTKMELKFLEGKLAECPLCFSKFLIRGKDVKDTDSILSCPQCTKGEFELTVEGRATIIQDLAKLSIEKSYQAKFKELQRYEQNLKSTSERLDLEFKKVALKSNEFDKVKDHFLEEYKLKYDKLLARYHELKLTRGRISDSVNRRRSEIRKAKELFEEEKRAFRIKKEALPVQNEVILTEVGETSHDVIEQSIKITLSKILEG